MSIYGLNDSREPFIGNEETFQCFLQESDSELMADIWAPNLDGVGMGIFSESGHDGHRNVFRITASIGL